MPVENTPYERLPGRASGLISTYTLYMAEDHLLFVDQPWFYQMYTRFYFRDIQSIVISDSRAFVGLNIFFGGLLTLSLILTLLFFSAAPGASYFFGVLAITFLVAFIVNLAKGPTCKLAIGTRVNRKVITSLGRKRTAYRVLPIIERKIYEFQDGRKNMELIADAHYAATQATQPADGESTFMAPTGTPVAEPLDADESPPEAY